MAMLRHDLDAARLAGDSPADQLINQVDRQSMLPALYESLTTPYDKISLRPSNLITSFLLARPDEPSWFDEKRTIQGQLVFEKYGHEIMALLGILSLPYCYAGYPGNVVVHRSDRMRHSPGKRLFDTASFVINVSSKASFQSKKYGHIAIRHTRLVHALARYHLQAKSWNIAWGAPINQEDMAATNLAFSCLILIGLQKSGIVLTQEEKEDYIFLWRYIGFALGIDETLLPSGLKDAYLFSQVFKERNIRASAEGAELTRELIDFYKSVIPPNQSHLVESQMRYFLGEEISGFLALKTEAVKDHLVSGVNAIQSIRNFLNPEGPSKKFDPDTYLMQFQKLAAN
jgi:hypothetical protein